MINWIWIYQGVSDWLFCYTFFVTATYRWEKLKYEVYEDTGTVTLRLLREGYTGRETTVCK